MIHISNFDANFTGRTFRDTSSGVSGLYTIVGYGDNQGNPYLVGLVEDKGRVFVKTVLLKNVEFVPSAGGAVTVP